MQARELKGVCAEPNVLPRRGGLPAEQVAEGAVPLASVWHSLVSGALRVTESFCGEQRCYLAVTAEDPPRENTRPLSPRDLDILRRVLRGEMQKRVGIDRQRSPSTISVAASNGLRRFGIDCTARRAPLLLALAACAAEHPGAAAVARLTPIPHDSKIRFLVSAERPDRLLPSDLTPAECRVVRGVLGGLSNREIAGDHHSARTVANQIATIFRKLAVGSRRELIAEVVRRAVVGRGLGTR
jgi:DNA-binding NarL/FixJ family response regulator